MLNSCIWMKIEMGLEGLEMLAPECFGTLPVAVMSKKLRPDLRARQEARAPNFVALLHLRLS